MLGIFELHVKKAFHSTVASLVAKINEVKEVISNMDRDNVPGSIYFTVHQKLTIPGMLHSGKLQE
jgi:hypothetical protein